MYIVKEKKQDMESFGITISKCLSNKVIDNNLFT